MEKTTIGVLLVITSPIVREGIIYLLVAENDITIVGVAGISMKRCLRVMAAR